MAALGRRIGLFLLLALWHGPLLAGPVRTEHAEIEMLADTRHVAPGETFTVAFRLTPDPNWHTYWRNPGDSGMATRVSWQLPEGFAAGELLWQAPERISIEPLTSYGYHAASYHLARITAPAAVEEGQTYTLAAKVDWLICEDVCVPESATLSMAFTGAAVPPAPVEKAAHDAQHIAEAMRRVPQTRVSAALAVEGGAARLRLSPEGADAAALEKADYFAYAPGVTRHGPVPEWAAEEGGLVITVPLEAGQTPESLPGVAVLTFAEGHSPRELVVEVETPPAAAASPAETPAEPAAAPPVTAAQMEYTSVSVPLMLAFALLGGLILNAMPCVFPILSLKVLAITRKGGMSRSAVRANGIAYTAGVLLSFWVMAVLLLTVQRAGAEIGWGFQMQSPLFVIGLALVLYLVGLNLSGLFHLPSVALSGQGRGDGIAGSLTTGILATVVATPCTAPFMAAAIGFALSQPPAVSLAVFTALGLGLALPFLLISLFPALVAFLPKPGHWMETFKQLLAFPMYASAAWLVWVAAQQVNETGLALIFATLVLVPFTIWLAGAGSSWPRPLRILLILLLVGLTGLAAYRAAHEPVRPAAAVHGEGREAFSQERLAALRQEGRPVFVTATAAWCITCKYNEAAAIDTEAVQQAFRDRGITYLIADWTNQDDAITHYLEHFGRKGVPLYVFYPAGGEPRVLPQILTPSVVLDYIQPDKE